MKTVFKNHSEICHVFANRIQNSGRASNIFFDDDVLYSYARHFELAQFVEYNNKTYLFRNTQSYSNSTSKHQNHFFSAINPVKQDKIFSFDFIGGKFSLISYSIIEAIESLILEAHKGYVRQLKAISRTHEHSKAASKQQTAQVLLIEFKDLLTISEGESLQSKLDGLKELQSMSESKVNSIQISQQARNEKKIEKEKENLAKWLNGSFNGTFYNLPIHLRLQGGNVQTSFGASVPLEHARHLISQLDKGIDITGKKIGYYTINQVTLDYIKIGCHKMFFSDINSFIDNNLRTT